VTVLDLLFETVDNTEKDFGRVLDYEYWSINKDGNYLYGRKIFDNSIIGDNIKTNLGVHIDFIGKRTGYEAVFVPYGELEFWAEIEVEIKGKLSYNVGFRNPLCCVRGACLKPCENKADISTYCMRGIPCMNNRPDRNCLSIEYPEFDDFLFDVVKFVHHCPHTDTFIVMFRFLPHEEGLDFKDVLAAVLVKDKKITFISDSDEIKKIYEDYNKKYPTADREVEETISYYNYGFHFKF